MVTTTLFGWNDSGNIYCTGCFIAAVADKTGEGGIDSIWSNDETLEEFLGISCRNCKRVLTKKGWKVLSDNFNLKIVLT